VIVTLVVAALALLAVAYVAAALRDGDEAERDQSMDAAELAGRKRAALTAILDMEEERDAGKLSPADFAVLRREYEAEAAAALAELDELSAGADPEEADVEAEIAAIRARLHQDAPSLEPCPSCGTPRAPGRACERCGA
jgi:hypothetical protein